jgi:hypothetical protein
MTVTLDRPWLADALGLPGARAVSLLDPDGPAVLWWAGADPPGEQLAATVVALSTAAAGLVSLTDPADELGDIILTSTDAFHVLRLIGDGSGHVAHLTLRRAQANLAMARREFGLLVEGYAVRGRHAAAATAVRTPGLPRRERADPPGATEEVVTADVSADWFALINAPYVTDDYALDRILVTLRSL